MFVIFAVGFAFGFLLLVRGCLRLLARSPWGRPFVFSGAGVMLVLLPEVARAYSRIVAFGHGAAAAGAFLAVVGGVDAAFLRRSCARGGRDAPSRQQTPS